MAISNPPPPALKPSHSSQLKASKKFLQSVAAKISGQPFQYSDPNVCGVLTAISEKARKLPQGMHMLLTSDVHEIGRAVDDYRFRLVSPEISALHCKIYRKRVATEDTHRRSDVYFSVFLKDYSTNGTFLNWEKLNKRTREAKLRHGDIVSFASAPKHGRERALVFVYREVQKSSFVSDGGSLKRKSEYGAENKRLKGIGIGSSDGPISLDDFRSLQRSITELKESKETIAESYQDQLSQLSQYLETKEKELEELTKISAELKHGMEDLNERLSASTQSCLEANAIINSQKVSISELKAVLDEERNQRREEREKASLDMKMALQSLRKEFECEKAAREEAWAKVSALELEISAAVRDLDFERRRLKGARERIMIRETQLHAFYSTTEKISALFAMQQEQFKSLQKTLEDEENKEAASIDINLNLYENRSTMDRDNNNKEVAHQSNSTSDKDQDLISSDEASVAKKNDCSNARSHENVIDTQEVEFNGAHCGINNNAKGSFCSDIVGTVEISHMDAIGTEHIPETEGISTSPAFEGTEHIMDIESQIARILIDLNTNATNNPVEVQDPMEDTGVKDLLDSEVLCRLTCSTAPLVHGEHDSHSTPVHGSNSLQAKVITYHQSRREGLRPRRGMRRCVGAE